MKNQKIEGLTCSCCGDSTKGRQWFNRDRGYGICNPCAASETKNLTPVTMKACYGVAGEHYQLKGAQ